MLAPVLPTLSRPLNVLCLGAHSDDIEIGCAGTLLRWSSEREINVTWVVFAGLDQRAIEARDSALQLLAGCRDRRIILHEFRDGFFPYVGADIKDAFERLKQEPSPDVIFTHTRNDRHQDHRVLNELTWNTYRDHLILEYEIPKYDGDLGSPNVFVTLDDTHVEKKIQHLLNHFATQRSRRWFDEETFRGLMRIRGVECGVRYAEAFHGRKVIL